MSETTSGSGAFRPDAAAGDTPDESDLPGLQGLDDDGTVRRDPDAADPNTPGAPDAGAAAAAAGEGGDPAAGADPMTDVGGAGRS
jgi:hypothetical protein